jgi:AcrR family transcriptional regulator
MNPPATNPAPARRLTSRGRERRRQLMDVAARRFASNGYHPTSVAEIVEGVGVGKGVFYWYFASKDALMEELLHEAHHSLRKRQQQAIGDEPDPVRRLELGIRASMAWFDENRHLVTLFQFAATEERFARVLRENQDVAIADTSRHVKDAMAEGLIPDADPTVVSHAILGVTAHLARTFVHVRNEPVDAISDAAVSFCLSGLGVTAAPR